MKRISFKRREEVLKLVKKLEAIIDYWPRETPPAGQVERKKDGPSLFNYYY